MFFFFQNEDNTFDPRLVTKLAQNYRALPSIMSIYSNLFYHSELIETINESDSGEIKLLRQLKENKILPHSDKTNENFAVYFYGLRGREEQSTESSSWRNICEANAVSHSSLHRFNSIQNVLIFAFRFKIC